MKRILVVGLIAAIMPLAAMAQTSTPAAPKHETVAQTPKLTELEQLKLENLELKIRAIFEEAQRQIGPVMQPLQSQRQALIEQLNKEHPGYHWQDARNQGEQGGFVANSPPSPAKK